MDRTVLPVLWILTDGKAGDETPLIGVAEALGVAPVLRHVAPRAPWVWAMPWGPIDPKDAASKPGSPLAPPFPDICLATGRRAVAYLRALKSVSPETLAVFFRDPRSRRHGADLLIVPAHDAPRGTRVLVTVTSPNRLSEEALAAARAAPPPGLAAFPRPRRAVLVGGDSRHHRFTAADIGRFAEGLERLADAEGSLMITASRRTPAPLRAALERLAGKDQVVLWDGAGDNPFVAYLALADEIVVTADSINMIGEAAATGRPVQVFHPSGGHPKLDAFLSALGAVAHVGRFPEAPAAGSYPPVNATPAIAAAIRNAWEQHGQR
jgi:mitochondrial fission protein ELM1